MKKITKTTAPAKNGKGVKNNVKKAAPAKKGKAAPAKKTAAKKGKATTSKKSTVKAAPKVKTVVRNTPTAAVKPTTVLSAPSVGKRIDGTASKQSYLVVSQTSKGVIGLKQLGGGDFRVRVVPASSAGLSGLSDWNQPVGSNNRYSTVVSSSFLFEVLSKAVAAIAQ